MSHSEQVRIVEVGPRDGLQNEKGHIATADKVKLIEDLVEAGVRHIEAGSFVSPKWVPQMADSAEVLAAIQRQAGTCYAALTPNLKGYEAARDAQVGEVAVFASASEAFSQRNINCSIAESLERFLPVMQAAKGDGIRVRGYVSCMVACPYEGPINPDEVVRVSAKLLEMGCYEVSVADTIGVATPNRILAALEPLLKHCDSQQLALHCHDTYGQALANIYAALDAGIRIIDSSIAGLGGCPYAKGASGNVATEDVLYLLHNLGYQTGVDLDKAIEVGNWISDRLGRPTQSSVGRAK